MITDFADYLRRHHRSLWGQKHMVTPRLVDWIHGDGLQLIALSPTHCRPRYYLARIDSKIELDNWSDNEETRFCDAVLPDLYDAIEDQFGCSREEWEHDNGRTYVRHRNFPAIDRTDGCSWGFVALLKKAETRPESELRKLLRRPVRK